MAQLVNAKRVGAVGDGVTNDANKLQVAINQAGAGGTVYIPAGTYLCANLVPLAGQTIVGDGKHTVLKRGPTKPDGSVHNGIQIEAVEISGLRVANLAIEVVSWSNYMTGVYVYGCTDVTIEDCSIYHTGALGGAGWVGGPPWTLHSILAGGVDRLTVRGCFTDSMQMKLEGHRIICAHNLIRRPNNVGISSVTFTDDNEMLSDVAILDNIIEDPNGHGGIYVGTDVNFDARSEYRNLVVRGNQVIGAYNNPGGNASGIIARPGRIARGWIIENNVLRAQSYAGSNGQGIVMSNVDAALLEDCIIRGNVIINHDQAGIALSSKLKNVVVSDNIVRSTRGIRIAASGAESWISVRGNHVEGIYDGIRLHAFSATLNADLRDNVLHDIGTDGANTESGIRVVAEASRIARVNAFGNRCRNVRFGIREEGAGTFDTAYAHNDLRGCTTPISVGGSAYVHENRVA